MCIEACCVQARPGTLPLLCVATLQLDQGSLQGGHLRTLLSKCHIYYTHIPLAFAESNVCAPNPYIFVCIMGMDAQSSFSSHQLSGKAKCQHDKQKDGQRPKRVEVELRVAKSHFATQANCLVCWVFYLSCVEAQRHYSNYLHCMQESGHSIRLLKYGSL